MADVAIRWEGPNNDGVAWWRPWAQWLPLAILVVGVTMLGMAFVDELHDEADAVDHSRTVALNDLVNDIERRFDATVNDLLTLKGLFEASEEVTRDQFAQFITSSDMLNRHAGYQAIEWAPLVRAEEVDEFVESVRSDESLVPGGYPDFEIRTEGERDWLTVVNYVEPLVGNEAAFGFDLSSSPARLSAIETSRRTGSPVATEPITLVQETGSQVGMLMIDSVVSDDSTEPDGFEGVLLTVFRVGDLLNGVKVDGSPDFIVTDTGEFDSRQGGEEITVFDSAENSTASETRATIDVAGRRLSIALADGTIPGTSSVSVLLRVLPGLIALLAIAWALRTIVRSGDLAARRAERLTAELRERNESLKRANFGLESFTRVASHDLRSPLRAIASLVGFIREDADEELDPEVANNLDRIEERVQRMNTLIDDLLTLSRTSAPEDERSHVTYADMIEEIVETVDVPEGFSVTTEFEGASSGYLARTQLALCVRNLVDNALKHHDKKTGTVRIRVVGRPHEVAVSVADDGAGIPAKYLEAVFEPFRRLRTDGSAPGSGIGLTTILKNTELLGGSVTVDSEEGMGSTFVIHWPLDSNPPSAPADPPLELTSSLT